MNKKNEAPLTINLTPFEELEDKHWYVVDLAAIAALAIAVFMYGEHQISAMQQKIEANEHNITDLQSSIDNVKAEVEAINELEDEIDELEDKIKNISSITISDLARYQSVMLVEFMQILKPVGMWYNSLDISEGRIEVSGHVHDPVMVADFMRSLTSTQTQKEGEDDLRSKLYFDKISIKKFQGSSFKLPGNFPPLKKTHSFSLSFDYKTRD